MNFTDLHDDMNAPTTNAKPKQKSEAVFIVNGRSIACVALQLGPGLWKVTAQIVTPSLAPEAVFWGKLAPGLSVELETLGGIRLEDHTPTLNEARARAEHLANRLGYMQVEGRQSRSSRRNGWT